MKLRIAIAALLLVALCAGVGSAWWHWTGPGDRQPLAGDPPGEHQRDEQEPRDDGPAAPESEKERDGNNEGLESPQVASDPPEREPNESPPPEDEQLVDDNGKDQRDPPPLVNNPPQREHVMPEIDPDWGHFSGTIVFHGEAPPAPRYSVNADRAFCGRHALVDESLLVDPMGRGVKNVVVYLYQSRSDAPPKIHPAYEARAADRIVLDNKDCRFEPHITLLRTTQTLVLTNSDRIGHNAKVDARHKPTNSLIPSGGEFETKFDSAERLPCQVGCNIHPWMRGYIVIKDNPYMAVTDRHGKFRIDNLPVGEWTFQFWHEEAGYLREVTVDGKPTEWPRGRLKVEIQPGNNGLGKVAMTVED